MKKSWISILLVVVFLIGLSLVLYPTFSDYWNSLHQSRAIASYEEEIRNMDTGEKELILKEAANFNEELKTRSNSYMLTDELRLRYKSVLDTSGTGIMGYINVPAINETLPIYHGTSEGVLQNAIGHIEWSSLPVGGEGTHAVLSGHRGLPSAKLFSDLDKVVVGDVFMIQVLDETLTYEVDQILIVEPEDVSALRAVSGKDYCTLVTCTPYGVNTHRMLVRGHRIENIEATKTAHVVSEAIQIDPMIVAPVLSLPLLVLAFVLLVVFDTSQGIKNRKDRKKSNMDKNEKRVVR